MKTASEKKNVSRAAGVVGFYTLISRILGLLRDMVLARFFGTGMVADAFFVAFRIPNLLRRLFAEGSLTIAFIPVFTEYLTNRSRKEALELARIVLTLLSLILSGITVLGILLSPWIVRIQAFGFGGTGVKYDLTVLLTRITFPYIFFIGIVAFFMGVLNSLRRFAAPAAAPIFLNAGIVGSAYVISPHLSEPIVGVALGVLIGGGLQVLLQIPWVVKEGLPFTPLWQPRHRGIRKIGLLMLPAIFGSAVYQLNQFMGTLLASFLREGSVSWLYYADRLVQFPLGVFAIALSTAALPSLSSQAAKGEMGALFDTLSHALRMVFFITLPSMAGLLCLGEPIIRVFFEGGAFDAFSTHMTHLGLMAYTGGLWAFSGTRMMVSAFYALQDTKTPVKVAVVALVLNGGLSLLLMGPLHHAGLALALSLASSIQFCLLIYLFVKKIGIGDLKPIGQTVLRCMAASIVMGVGVHVLHRHWFQVNMSGGSFGMCMELGILVGMGGLFYFATAALFRCAEISSILDLVKDRLQRVKHPS